MRRSGRATLRREATPDANGAVSEASTAGQRPVPTRAPRAPARGSDIRRSQPLETLPEFLSPEEFRVYVGIGRGAMYALLQRHEIPHVRFGRLIRIQKHVLTSLAIGRVTGETS